MNQLRPWQQGASCPRCGLGVGLRGSPGCSRARGWGRGVQLSPLPMLPEPRHCGSGPPLGEPARAPLELPWTPGWGLVFSRSSQGSYWGSVLTAGPVSPASGRVRLAVLPEDQLQMDWKESGGGGLGYLVQVKPRAGKEWGARCPPPCAHPPRTGGPAPQEHRRGLSLPTAAPWAGVCTGAPPRLLEQRKSPRS